MLSRAIGTLLCLMALSSNAQSITKLPPANLPLSGQEEVPLVQSGVTKQTTVGNILGAAGAGGLPNQIQFNSNGILGGFSVVGDGTLNPQTGKLTITSTNGTLFGTAATANLTSILPSATLNQLYGGTGIPGAASPINLGAGFAISGGTLITTGGVTWPATNSIVISNNTSSPLGLAPVNGNCVVGSGGAWTTGACGAGTVLTGTTNTLGFYASNGTTLSPLTLGTNLSITGTTLNAVGGTGLTIGTSTITSGTTTRVLYDNAGIVGEYVVSGSGSVCMTTSCAMTTPNLGTPSAATLTNATGLPISGITGLGTGVGTALGNNTKSSGGLTTFGTDLPLGGGTMTGELVTAASSAGTSGFNLPHGSAPTSPVNGDCWTTTGGLFCQINGSTVGPYASSAGGASNVLFSGTTSNVSNAYTISSPAGGTWSSNTDGYAVLVKFNAANSGDSTLAVGSGSAAHIEIATASGLTTLAGAELNTTNTYFLSYQGTCTCFVLQTHLTPSIRNVTSSQSPGVVNIVSGDAYYLNASSLTVTLPAASGVPSNSQFFVIANGNSTTIIPNGTDNINGANANLAIPANTFNVISISPAGAWTVNSLASSLAPNVGAITASSSTTVTCTGLSQENIALPATTTSVTLTMAAGLYDHQQCMLRIKQGGTSASTVAFCTSSCGAGNAPVIFSTNLTGYTVTSALSEFDIVGLQYDLTKTSWLLMAVNQGFGP